MALRRLVGPERYDLVLHGGLLVDPEGRSRVATVAIGDGRVAAIDPPPGYEAAEGIDCTGRLVLPGLVDAHVHVFAPVSKLGVPADEAALRRGVVAVADAGSAGASTFAAFDEMVVQRMQTRVLSFLNVSVLGLIDFRLGELRDPDALCPEDGLEVAQANPDVVRGFKIRMSEEVVGKNGPKLLGTAVDLAERAGLPLMVHIGDTTEPLPRIVEQLRRGDIVSHCFTGRHHGIIEQGHVLDDVVEARRRGVIFDAAHGRGNFSFAVAQAALSEGFLPDLISSDTSRRNWNGPVFDLVTTMSKFLGLGLPIEEVVRRSTLAPARLLGIDDDGFGSITVGQPANITVLEEVTGVPMVDAHGTTLECPQLDVIAVVAGGRLVDVAPRREERDLVESYFALQAEGQGAR